MTRANREVILCSECGAKRVEYPHVLNKGIVGALVKLVTVGGGEAHYEEIGLTHVQKCNFQKLRYFGLVEMVEQAGAKKTGRWRATERGREFVFGRTRVHRRVWTYRTKVMRLDGGKVSIGDVDVMYKKSHDYAREAVPHTDTQPELGL